MVNLPTSDMAESPVFADTFYLKRLPTCFVEKLVNPR